MVPSKISYEGSEGFGLTLDLCDMCSFNLQRAHIIFGGSDTCYGSETQDYVCN